MKWEVLHSEIVCRCRIFDVRRQTSRRRQDGPAHDFHVIETRDWVTVLPITRQGEVVMVRQFRHGIGSVTLEVPAGVVDPTDPSPSAAAERELLEETGYVGRRFEGLGSVHPNPAIMNNRCHVFAARDAELSGATAWDATEELVLEVVPLARVSELIRAGAISNALTLVAFQLFDLANRNR
jgi:8-oxo-dGTP pyrophosphatase MutT (NUDIX family)